MRDRLLRGAVAGMLAGLFLFAVNYVSLRILQFSKARWVDAVSQLMFGHPAITRADWVMAAIAEAVLLAGLGFVFARLIIPEPGTGNYLLRGMGFALVVWLVIESLGGIFRVPHLYFRAWQTSVTNLVAVSGWGLLLGWLMRRWDRATLVER